MLLGSSEEVERGVGSSWAVCGDEGREDDGV